MRMPDSSSKQTFPLSSATLQRCWFGRVGRVVDGGMVTVVVVGDSVVDFVLLADGVLTLTTMLDALFSALECWKDNLEPLSSCKHATTANIKTQTISDSNTTQSHKNGGYSTTRNQVKSPPCLLFFLLSSTFFKKHLDSTR